MTQEVPSAALCYLVVFISRKVDSLNVAGWLASARGCDGSEHEADAEVELRAARSR